MLCGRNGHPVRNQQSPSSGGKDIRVEELRVAQRGQLLSSTNPINTAEMLLRRRDLAIRAARSVGPGISNLEARQTWRWAKVHGIPIAHYLGKGTNGATMLREELEAGNEGIRIPSAIRWLAGQQMSRPASTIARG